MNVPTTSLTTCAHCNREPTPGIKFRRCAGCRAAPLYCSKECQRAQWPIHKISCNALSHQRDLTSAGLEMTAEFLRYTSPDNLLQAVGHFVKAHDWAFMMAMRAHAVLTYGLNEHDHPMDLIPVMSVWTMSGYWMAPSVHVSIVSSYCAVFRWKPFFEDWLDYETGVIEYPALTSELATLKSKLPMGVIRCVSIRGSYTGLDKHAVCLGRVLEDECFAERE
ncbi:hypothetical protein C8Q76DRAFT_693433 [Earliella scabrosa]|nr:hypothetical protein C8Q76DRAFT_693433 [Earliella scabrosa]